MAEVATLSANSALAMDDGQPRAWLLMGHKAGDNTQVLALAEALGWPFEIKRLVYRRTELLSNVLLGPSLAGIVKHRSSSLAAPWPDLVISAGRRNEPVGRWIQEQADKAVRLVHLGRPWAGLERFDLIVTTPQYRLPERGNILRNEMPLHRINEQSLNQAASFWEPRLAHLPRPFIAVLVGGHSGSYVFGAAEAKSLGGEANAMARDAAGSLLISTSARTPAAAVDALKGAITVPAHFFQWSSGAADNPYYGYLALADAFIVTGDSISMLTEASVTRKPLYIFDIGEGPTIMHSSGGKDRPRRTFRAQALISRLAMRLGPRRMTRDISIMHQSLIASGRAVWLGQRFPTESTPPPLADVQRAVARVRALFAPRVSSQIGRVG